MGLTGLIWFLERDSRKDGFSGNGFSKIWRRLPQAAMARMNKTIEKAGFRERKTEDDEQLVIKRDRDEWSEDVEDEEEAPLSRPGRKKVWVAVTPDSRNRPANKKKIRGSRRTNQNSPKKMKLHFVRKTEKSEETGSYEQFLVSFFGPTKEMDS